MKLYRNAFLLSQEFRKPGRNYWKVWTWAEGVEQAREMAMNVFLERFPLFAIAGGARGPVTMPETVSARLAAA